MEMRRYNRYGCLAYKRPKLIKSYDEGWSEAVKFFNRHPNGFLLFGEKAYAFGLGQADRVLWNAFKRDEFREGLK